MGYKGIKEFGHCMPFSFCVSTESKERWITGGELSAYVGEICYSILFVSLLFPSMFGNLNTTCDRFQSSY